MKFWMSALRIPRSQKYVYGRSVLGKVQRYLRIDVDTGKAEEIQRDNYMRRAEPAQERPDER